MKSNDWKNQPTWGISTRSARPPASAATLFLSLSVWLRLSGASCTCESCRSTALKGAGADVGSGDGSRDTITTTAVTTAIRLREAFVSV